MPCDLTGVRGILNQIAVRPGIQPTDVQASIEAAFRRSAEIDARRINVSVTDSKVTLDWEVHSGWSARSAERAAWAAPGVAMVDDRLSVMP